MKEGIFIHGRQILLRQGGSAIELDIVSAKRIAQRIIDVVDEVELLLEEDRLLWREIHQLDLKLRNKSDVWWAKSLQLMRGNILQIQNPTNGIYCGHHRNSNDGTVTKLGKRCFDSLLKGDIFIKIRFEQPNVFRLRSMSESMQWWTPRFYNGDESVDAWEFESPSRTVNLNQGFWMGSVPVTHIYTSV